jgi:hypothetical protein
VIATHCIYSNSHSTPRQWIQEQSMENRC